MPMPEADEEMAGRMECSKRIACDVRQSVGQGGGAEEGRSQGFDWVEQRSAGEVGVDVREP